MFMAIRPAATRHRLTLCTNSKCPYHPDWLQTAATGQMRRTQRGKQTPSRGQQATDEALVWRQCLQWVGVCVWALKAHLIQ